MSEVRFYRVKNHDRFQHYKRRNPPWIKFHASAMTDYAFSSLPDEAKWHAIGIAVLASQTDNHIPSDAEWVGRLIGATRKVEFEPLLSIGFLVICECSNCMRKQDASKLLARCKQSAMPEERREEERRDRAEQTALPEELDTPQFSEKWAEWLEYRRKARKPVTEIGEKRQLKNLAKYGTSIATQAIDQSIANDWQGLFPEKIPANGRKRSGKTDAEIAVEQFGWADHRLYDENGMLKQGG